MERGEHREAWMYRYALKPESAKAMAQTRNQRKWRRMREMIQKKHLRLRAQGREYHTAGKERVNSQNTVLSTRSPIVLPGLYTSAESKASTGLLS